MRQAHGFGFIFSWEEETMQNQIAFLITADFVLLILLYCLKSIFLPEQPDEAESTVGDRQ
ncbi:hypothetical protein NIES208_02095 [[Limnothrix rosea] IAM M-220]|nr:hypothetical protein NIES208_02095 [[Limnothrix rosea] IAM M-220]